MKKSIIIILFFVISITKLNAQNVPFTIGEKSLFSELIQNGNNPCNLPFACEYTIDTKNSDWTGISPKEKQQIINNTNLIITHSSEITTCKLTCENKRLTTYTENNSGEALLTYFGDTVAFKSVFTLQVANPNGQEISSEICNQGKYDLEGFNCGCHRFVGKNVNHPEPSMATENFPAVNTIFNLYYGFEKPRYFPVSFYLLINGHKIAMQLKEITFDTNQPNEMPHMEDIQVCKELTYQEFYAITPELR